jgi:hypothetical protein
MACVHLTKQWSDATRNWGGWMDIMGKLMVWPVVMMIGGIGVWGQASAPPPPCLAPPPQARAKIVGYLAGREPDFHRMLPPYPEFNSMRTLRREPRRRTGSGGHATDARDAGRCGCADADGRGWRNLAAASIVADEKPNSQYE